MEQDGKFLLADELRKSIGRSDVAGGERGERRGVEVVDVAVGRDLLAVFVDEENELGVGVGAKFAQNRFDLIELLVIHHHISGRHDSDFLRPRPTRAFRDVKSSEV